MLVACMHDRTKKLILVSDIKGICPSRFADPTCSDLKEFFGDLFWVPGLIFTAIYVLTAIYYIKTSKAIRDFSIIYDPYDMKHYEEYKIKLENSS